MTAFFSDFLRCRSCRHCHSVDSCIHSVVDWPGSTSKVYCDCRLDAEAGSHGDDDDVYQSRSVFAQSRSYRLRSQPSGESNKKQIMSSDLQAIG